jgi:hypothetical protein
MFRKTGVQSVAGYFGPASSPLYWPFGVPPPLFVVGPVVVCWPVSLLLLQAEVWVVVVSCVKPAFELGGFVTVVVVVPQSLVLSAWAAGENKTPLTAIRLKADPNSSAFNMCRSYKCQGFSVFSWDRQWPPGVPPPLFVVGPVVVVVCSPVSLLLLQAAVWVSVVVVVCVKPAFPLGGFVTSVVAVVVPQFLTLSAWAIGDSQTPLTAAKVKADPKSGAFTMSRSYEC